MSGVEDGIIDCDVHPYMPDGVEAIFPYISDGWRKRLDPYKGMYVTRGRKGTDSRVRYPSQEGLKLARGPVPWGSRVDEVPPSGDLPGSDPNFMVERLLNAHNVDIALLLPTQPLMTGTFVNADDAAMIAQGFNDCFIEKWLSVDSRFRLAIVVSPHDPQQAAAEIRRVGSTKGVVGVMMPLLNVLLGDRHFWPIYEAAQDLGLQVMTHPNGAEADFHGNPVFAGGIPGSYVEKYSMVGQLAQSHTINLVFQGTFETFPKLKVIFIEYGWSFVAPMVWRMDAVWKASRRIVPWVKRLPSEYVNDHIRFTTQPALECPNQTYLDNILEMMTASRTLLFSSDYPHWDSDNPDFAFRGIQHDLHRRIFRDNAIETFGERLALQPAAERTVTGSAAGD